jgi:hypothetical protein
MSDAQGRLIQVNPIKWALSLLSEPQGAVSAFGGGFFDDAGDLPGQPVLYFTISVGVYM